MDELADRLNQILGDPRQMEQIRQMVSAMGLGGAAGPSSEPPSGPSPGPLSGNGGPDMSAILKLAPLLKLGGENDETVAFLLALRPLLSEERRRKLDEAVRILRVLRLLPLLKNTGILF